MKEDTVTPSEGAVCPSPEFPCGGSDSGLTRAWLHVGVAAIFAGQSMVFSLALNMTPPEYGSTAYWVLHGGLIASALLVFVFLGGNLMRATRAMFGSGRLSIDGLFMLSLVGAFCGSLLSTFSGTGAIFYEVVSVVIAIHALGRVFSERSLTRLKSATDELSERFDRARVQRGDRWEWHAVSTLSLGEIVRIEPGDPVSVDGLILSGTGYVNESALSGEPLPIVRRAGDRLRAGTHALDGAFGESRGRDGNAWLDGILKTVRSVGRPSQLQTQADRLIQFFLPLVAGVSLLTGLYWLWATDWTQAVLMRWRFYW